jgi:hypothetical protein
MSVQRAQRGERVQTFGGNRAFAGGLVANGDLGIVPPGGLDELRGGAGVEAVGGVEGEGNGSVIGYWILDIGDWILDIGDAEVVLFGEEGLAGFFVDGVKGAAQTGLDGSGNSAFDERSGTKADVEAHVLGQKFEGHLCAQNGAAQIHQDEDTIRGVDALDRLVDFNGVRSEFGAVIPNSSRNGDRDLQGGNLPGKGKQGVGEGAAM